VPEVTELSVGDAITILTNWNLQYNLVPFDAQTQIADTESASVGGTVSGSYELLMEPEIR
jgi:hypothetical protein